MTFSVTTWVWIEGELVECRRLFPGEKFRDGDVYVFPDRPRRDDGTRVGRRMNKAQAEHGDTPQEGESTQFWRPLFMEQL